MRIRGCGIAGFVPSRINGSGMGLGTHIMHSPELGLWSGLVGDVAGLEGSWLRHVRGGVT